MELLDTKISELFWDTIFDFLRFHAYKTWLGGQNTPARVSSPPPTIFDMQSDMLLRPIK